MTRRNLGITETIKLPFDIEKFESLINVNSIINQLQNENLDSRVYLTANSVSQKISIELDNLKKVLSNINELGNRNNYDIKWLMSGKNELNKVFSVIDLLEFNIHSLLNELENHDGTKTDSILDTLSTICNSNLSIKTMTYPLKVRLAVINHFNELRNEVLASVHNELLYCTQKLEDLNIKKDLLSITNTLNNFTLKDFLQKRKENEMASNDLVLNGFIIISTTDSQIYSTYTELHAGLSPIAESLKIIPTALNDFFNSSKTYYKSLIKTCVSIYDDIMRLYRRYTDNLRKFKSEYILERNDLICEIIFKEINITNNQPIEVLEKIISILKPIDQNFGLSGQHQKLLKDVEYKLNCIQLEENIFKTPVPKAKNNSTFRRNFSNPLTDTLNMKPVLSVSNMQSEQESKIFYTPKLFDQSVFSNENNEIIKRIKLELEPFERDEGSNGNTPISDQSFSSSSSSPETMRVKNIFDSPDPFVTPSSRNFQRSRLPVSTPLTTPRITPTKKYVMLPIDEEPRIINDWNNKGITIQKPLLRYELSTVIKAEHYSEEDTSNDSGDGSPCEASQITTSTDSKIDSSPPVSRIPLPLRPESRLNLLRSASRLDVERGRQIPSMRPDSRLANMATSISSKLGTTSPAITASSKLLVDRRIATRSNSVMTNRELKPLGSQYQTGRLPQGQHGLNIVKTRGRSALESRSNFTGSRVTTL